MDLKDITEYQIKEVRAAGVMPPNANDTQVRLYIRECARHEVDPLSRMVTPILMGGRLTFHAGIDLCRSRANATGELAGCEVDVDEDKNATATVWRMVQGQRCPFKATALWSEYDTGRSVWKQKGRIMIEKCAEMLALRRAFPQQLSGLYESAELDAAKGGES